MSDKIPEAVAHALIDAVHKHRAQKVAEAEAQHAHKELTATCAANIKALTGLEIGDNIERTVTVYRSRQEPNVQLHQRAVVTGVRAVVTTSESLIVRPTGALLKKDGTLSTRKADIGPHWQEDGWRIMP